MEIIIRTDRASVELFFNIFTTGNERVVIPWDQLLYPCVIDVCRLGLEPLSDTHLLCHSENAGTDRRGISWGVRKDGHNCQCWLQALFFVFWCQLLWQPPGAQFSEQQVLRDNFVQQGAGNDWWHSWWWISIGAMLCAFKNFITDRTSQSAGARIRASNFNRCNDATTDQELDTKLKRFPVPHARDL